MKSIWLDGSLSPEILLAQAYRADMDTRKGTIVGSGQLTSEVSENIMDEKVESETEGVESLEAIANGFILPEFA